MLELLWLLLPIAAVSGWYAAKRSNARSVDTRNGLIPDGYIKGVNFLLNEQPDRALEVFLQIVDVDSETVETHIVLGNLFRRKGEVERAIRIHQNLITRPNLDKFHRANALLELGRDYLKAGLLDRAENVFHEVIEYGLQSKEAYQHLRVLYEQEKDWEKAINNAINFQIDTGQSQDKEIAHYYCELGELAKVKNQIKEAQRIIKMALAYDQTCMRANIMLGDLALQQSNYNEAIKYYCSVQVNSPEYLGVVLPSIKKAYEKKNNPQGYQRYLHKIRHQDIGMSSVLGLIDNYLKQGDKQAAESMLENELTKPSVPLRVLRAYISIVVDNKPTKHKEALKYIAQALDSHLKDLVSHKCTRCGVETRGIFWQCPGCHGWGTIQPINRISTTTHSRNYNNV